jgi:phosphohistidine phosphatase
MKRLLLMRHGQAGWDSDEQNDFDRFLTPQGQADNKTVGGWMAAQSFIPDIALVSEACRTAQTWDILGKCIPAGTTVRLLEELYLASPGALLSHIEKLDDDIQTAMILGHNPGLESLARLMSGPGSDEATAEDLRLGMPPAGLAVIELNGDSWRTMSALGGQLTHFIRPADLKTA